MLLYHKVKITYTTVERRTLIDYLIDNYKAICLALIATANRLHCQLLPCPDRQHCKNLEVKVVDADC